MPIYYENDSEYTSREEESADRRDAIKAKLEAMNKENIMDFDDFITKEGIGGVVHSKDRK